MTGHLIQLVKGDGNSPRGVIKPSMIKGAPQKWMHVCSVSEMTRAGIAITAEMLRSFTASFDESPEPGPIYLGHQDAERRRGEPEPPAAGWVLALDLRGNELWALYEMGPDLFKQVKTGGYRFNSICGRFQKDDDGRVVGADFWSIAVTNSPAVPGLEPMAASARRGREGLLMATDIKKILQAVVEELPKDATEAQAHKLIEVAVAKAAALAGGDDDEKTEPGPAAEPGAAPAAEPSAVPSANAHAPQVVAATDEGGETVALSPEMAMAGIQGVADVAGVGPDAVIASLTDNADAHAALVTGGTEEDEAGGGDTAPDSEFFTKSKQVMMSRVQAAESRFQEADTERVELASRVKELEADLREHEADQAVAGGLFLAADRDRMVDIARNSPDVWSRWKADAAKNPAVPTKKLVTSKRHDIGETEGLEGLSLDRDDLVRAITVAVPDPKRRHEMHPTLFPEPGSGSRA